MTIDKEKIAKEIAACDLYIHENIDGGENKQRVLIVRDYLQCLSNPTGYSPEQCENLRRLSLEYGFIEEGTVSAWVATLS